MTSFYKYQATGNDFVMIDDRDGAASLPDRAEISQICHRRFGVGADGLILLQEDPELDFRMVYYNADGGEGSMCGNGGRCAVAFAQFLGLDREEYVFRAVDGIHRAKIREGIVELQMADVDNVREKPSYCFVDTGSPHHVQIWPGLDQVNVPEEGKKLRYGLYGKAGSNINFVEVLADGSIKVRTYERGVEAETYSCGTGVTAVALALHHWGHLAARQADIQTRGGRLTVRFDPQPGGGFTGIWLCGPAQQVFKGIWE